MKLDISTYQRADYERRRPLRFEIKPRKRTNSYLLARSDETLLRLLVRK